MDRNSAKCLLCGLMKLWDLKKIQQQKCISRGAQIWCGTFYV